MSNAPAQSNGVSVMGACSVSAFSCARTDLATSALGANRSCFGTRETIGVRKVHVITKEF